MAIIAELKSVDLVIAQESMDKLETMKKYNVDVVFVGFDWKGTDAWNKYEKEFASVGCLFRSYRGYIFVYFTL